MFSAMKSFRETRQKLQMEMFKSIQETFQQQFIGMKIDSAKKVVSASALLPCSGKKFHGVIQSIWFLRTICYI